MKIKLQIGFNSSSYDHFLTRVDSDIGKQELYFTYTYDEKRRQSLPSTSLTPHQSFPRHINVLRNFDAPEALDMADIIVRQINIIQDDKYMIFSPEKELLEITNKVEEEINKIRKELQ